MGGLAGVARLGAGGVDRAGPLRQPPRRRGRGDALRLLRAVRRRRPVRRPLQPVRPGRLHRLQRAGRRGGGRVNRRLRRAGFVSLTLGAIGCGEPKEEPALRPKELFSSDTVGQDSRRGEGWRRFLAPAELHRAWVPASQSPWRPYYKPTLIAAIATVESAAMPVVNVGMPPAMDEARRFAATVRPGDTAIFVDLIGEQSVVWAAVLRQSGFVPVVAINNWPHQFGVLRLERPLGALLYYAD